MKGTVHTEAARHTLAKVHNWLYDHSRAGARMMRVLFLIVK
jgi:hypothetical protein